MAGLLLKLKTWELGMWRCGTKLQRTCFSVTRDDQCHSSERQWSYFLPISLSLFLPPFFPPSLPFFPSFFCLCFFKARFLCETALSVLEFTVEQDGPTLRDPPASASQVPGLKKCTTTARLYFCLYNFCKGCYHCQLDLQLSRDKLLCIPVREFLYANWGRKNHPICGWHHSIGWGSGLKKKENVNSARADHSSFSVSWWLMCYDQWYYDLQLYDLTCRDILQPKTVIQNEPFFIKMLFLGTLSQ